MPMTSARPMKCSVSQSGQIQILKTIACDSDGAEPLDESVHRQHSQVRHQAAGGDGASPQTSDTTASVERVGAFAACSIGAVALTCACR